MGVLKYVIANQDRFNFDANTWKTAVSPYVADPNAFNCPVVHSGEAYSFNSALFGANSMAVTEPANTVMIYEGKDQKLDFRHEGMAVVAYVDGHVRAISEYSAQKLKWTP
jgi:prepilin-type processing-associated H-X9-DG protein